MPNADLPVSVDSLKPFEQGSQRKGEILIARFSRLAPMLMDTSGEVGFELSFTFDSDKRRVIRGHLEALVQVQCQRCLEKMELTLSSGFALGVVDSDEMAGQLPAELEPLVAVGREIDLHVMLEDELIMALPPFPLHDEGECPAAATLSQINADADQHVTAADGERKNPFSVLAELTGKGSGKSDN